MIGRWLAGLIASALLHGALAVLLLRVLGGSSVPPPLLVDLSPGRGAGDAPPSAALRAVPAPVPGRSAIVPRRAMAMPPGPAQGVRQEDVTIARSPAATAPPEPRAPAAGTDSATPDLAGRLPQTAATTRPPVVAEAPSLPPPSRTPTVSADLGARGTGGSPVADRAVVPGPTSNQHQATRGAEDRGPTTGASSGPDARRGGRATHAGPAGGGAGEPVAVETPGRSEPLLSEDYRLYISHLRDILEKSIEYPTAARRRGISGTVEVDVLVEPTGRVRSVEVVTRAHPVLEDAAVEAVHRLRPGPIPSSLPRRPLRVRLPLVFALEPER